MVKAIFFSLILCLFLSEGCSSDEPTSAVFTEEVHLFLKKMNNARYKAQTHRKFLDEYKNKIAPLLLPDTANYDSLFHVRKAALVKDYECIYSAHNEALTQLAAHENIYRKQFEQHSSVDPRILKSDLDEAQNTFSDWVKYEEQAFSLMNEFKFKVHWFYHPEEQGIDSLPQVKKLNNISVGILKKTPANSAY